jgi:hypothetical protein
MKTDDLYSRACEILRAEPAMGKKRLADRLGVKTPTSRRLLWRFRGETQGHSPDPEYQRVREMKETHPEWTVGQIAQALHTSADRVMLNLARWIGAREFHGKTGTAPTAPAAAAATTEGPDSGSTLQQSGGENTRDLCYRGLQIRSLEDLLVYAQVDTAVWEVERWMSNKWEVGARNPVTGEILTAPLFQVKAWLKRKIAEVLQKEFAQELLQAFKTEAPAPAPVKYSPPRQGMLEIALYDSHIEKLCWGKEGGRDSNHEIAKKVFCNGLEDLLAKSAGYKPELILFPVGNDFFHTDILGRTTTAGTCVDSSIGWKQAFVEGWQLLAKAIERLRLIAPVRVVVVNGNHDLQSSFHLGEVLTAWFRQTDGVTVDNSPTQRKYVVFHKCLLGLTHGSEEKLSNLPMLMATERPVDWANSSAAAREIHIGHWHHQKSLNIVPAVDVSGVLVRVIPSLTPLDAWHASKGYCSKQAAEAFFWDGEYGVTASFTHSPG